MFAITSFTVRTYHNVERGFAVQWYARGEDDLHSGRAEAALADFRTALSYSHDNEQYALRLAEALTEAGRTSGARAEAQTYLLALLDRQPGNATVNLDLARLAARDHLTDDAVRYYHQAIYGEWDVDAVVRRRNAQLELVEYLLDEGQRDSARAELIALAADLPPDPALQIRVGKLLLRVAGYDDALKLFNEALRLNPHLPAALAGAGECFFYSGDYAQAEHYLARAAQQNPRLTQAAALRDTAQAVLRLDPFDRRLSNMERGRRAATDFSIAMAHLQGCAAQRGIDLNANGSDPLQTLHSAALDLQSHSQQSTLSRDAEMLSKIMDATFAMEQASAHACGEPQGQDLALVLIAREQGGAHP